MHDHHHYHYHYRLQEAAYHHHFLDPYLLLGVYMIALDQVAYHHHFLESYDDIALDPPLDPQYLLLGV